VNDASENLISITEVCWWWLPDEVHTLNLRLKQILFKAIIYLGNELSMIPKLWVNSGVSWWMTWCTHIPSYVWNNTEFFLHPFVTDHEIVDKVFIVWCCLIRFTPTSIHNLKLAILYKSFQLFSDFLRLSFIPHFEEFHVWKSELSFLISWHFRYNWIKD
jgi:hypothetical protein